VSEVAGAVNIRRALCLAALAFVVAACGEHSVTGPDIPVVPGATTFRGFDTSIYPGDAAMQAWKNPGSPYLWSGYYLAAPCHKDATWSGKRATITAMGWGTAIIYVGQQTFDGLPDLFAYGDPLFATVSPTCSRTLLSRDQGLADADDAIAKTLAEGFPPRSVIYLDLERMDSIPPAMDAYYRAWAEHVLASQYRPGVYVHKFNAPAVYVGFTAVYQAAGSTETPRFWLATAAGFSLTAKPTDIGYSFTNAWQGILDTDETWNGVRLHIDVDIADRKSPSAP